MAKRRHNFASTLRVFGNLLSVLAVLFLVNKLLDYREIFAAIPFTVTEVASLIFLMGVSGAANHMLSLAWWLLLAHYTPSVGRATAVSIYGQSLIGKYIPGNIFQFAARQVTGVEKGVNGRSIASASLVEIPLLATLPVLSAFWLIAADGYLDQIWLGQYVFPAVVLILLCGILLCRSWWIARSLILYSVFFGATGVVFASIFWKINADLLFLSPEFFLLVIIFTVGWFAGFATPGAPAGLGVREVAVIFLAQGRYPENDLVLAVAVSRLASTFGDFGYWMWAHFKIQKMESTNQN